MMKWIVIGIAAAGLGLGVWVAATTGEEDPEPPPAAPPSVNPFASGIAATGVVEAASRNVHVAAPEPGLVLEVFADVNQTVAKGDPLFVLDTRELEANLAVAQAQVEVTKAQAEFNRLESELTERAFEKKAATSEELARRRADLATARARIVEPEAQVELIRRRITVRRVTAPVSGTVLKREIEPGEYTMTGNAAAAPFVLGDLSTLHVRAQVNEEDATRLRPGARAIARLRGEGDSDLMLTMLRIEPLAIPKTQLTGVNTELVDTRVIEAVFELRPPFPPGLFPGQLIDVFIEAPAPPKAAEPAPVVAD